MIDRGVTQSDGQAISPLDRTDKLRSTMPPIAIPKQVRNLIHYFKSSYDTQWVSSTTVATFQALYFTLSNVTDAGSYETIFDEYAIQAACIRIIPIQGPNATNTLEGTLWTVLDHDDANVLASTTAAQEYSSVMITRGTQGQTRVVYPRLAEASYSGAFTSFTNTRAWCDVASPNIQHYGLKAAIGASTTATLYQVEVDLYFCCRNNR